MSPPHDDEANLEQSTIADSSSDVAKSAPLYVLRVVSGPDNGKTLVLDWNKTPQVLIGQSKVCELTLTDPRVSRRHLALTPDGAQIRIVDLRSTNGTRIGGARMLEALLEGGETVELGNSSFRVVRAGELPSLSAEGRDRFGRVIGKSHAMQRIFTLCEALSQSMFPVIVEGETGTGKELLAEALHETGPRAQGPFVVFDCAAHGEVAQLEALFGGADGTPGALEQAIGGTLVVDQVGELSPTAQSRLATIVERGELRRASGGTVRTNIRFIATTRDDLDRSVQEKTFREELLFRLAGARVEMPPLRQRHGDVEILARHFWRLFGGPGELPKRLAIQLARRDWPGNVRELQHAVSRATVLGDDGDPARTESDQRTQVRDFLEHVLGMGLPMPRARQLILREFERRFVERAVKEHGGNVSRAAAASGLTRRYFHMLLAKNKG